jgi:hypothetical protein
VQGLAGEISNQLRKFGFEASPVYAGNTPADGERRDVMPQNDRQRAPFSMPCRPSAARSTKTSTAASAGLHAMRRGGA